MGAASTADVRAFVIEAIAPRLTEVGLDPNTVTDDLDFIDTGVVDSLGLLELIGDVEERFGLEIDFEGAEPEELTRLGHLCERVAAQSAAPA